MAKRPSNRLVRKAIRDLIEPQIAALGFTGKYPEFRRDWQGETHFILFQTRKYGGGFSYSGAWRKRVRYVQSPTYSLPADEAAFVHTDFDDRATVVRIKEVGLVSTREHAWRSVGDFDYEHIVEDEAACRSLVEEALLLLPALDHWLKTREADRGIDARGHRMRRAVSNEALWHFAMAKVGQFSLENQRPQTPHLSAQDQSGKAPEYLIIRS
ncbi:hypothetical protein K3152_04480 [Qipengyuania sp. 1NDH17]|uniref:DUF4304 domain-containing protein n=1 Tax=Qipengyuania polymorpha TaxID=2867234 RepID=A0ABS7IZ61_9SPHN|nr:hypothetical protein [Qipengyuania polymorpha]MBX7457496.1 hypothetical protein [Qipengyuania polymorpha]